MLIILCWTLVCLAAVSPNNVTRPRSSSVCTSNSEDDDDELYDRSYLIDQDDLLDHKMEVIPGAKWYPFGDEVYTTTNHEDLSVLALNCWGIPGTPDLQERMEAIGGHVAKGQYDLVLLSELWIKTHHDIIRASLPYGYNMTTYEQLNGPNCLGAYTDQYFGLYGCSGLAVISRLPMSNITFTPFSNTGYFSNMLYDGEIFARKGIGSLILSLDNGLTIQVLDTHMCSEAWNDDIRNKQVDDFLEMVNSSDATFVIGGGDFNLWPVSEGYEKLAGVMVNAFQEKFPRSWNLTQFTTFGHSDNSFISEVEDEVLDYIFYLTKDDSEGTVVAKSCWLPFLTAIRSANESVMSVSDHQGIACTFQFRQKETQGESGTRDSQYIADVP